MSRRSDEITITGPHVDQIQWEPAAGFTVRRHSVLDTVDLPTGLYRFTVTAPAAGGAVTERGAFIVPATGPARDLADLQVPNG